MRLKHVEACREDLVSAQAEGILVTSSLGVRIVRASLTILFGPHECPEQSVRPHARGSAGHRRREWHRPRHRPSPRRRRCANYIRRRAPRYGCRRSGRLTPAGTGKTVEGDLGSRDACDALLAYARSDVGLVTHFVHSAAPAQQEADHMLAVSKETWKEMYAVNVDAGFHIARELGRQLIASREPGSFLMLTSLHAHTPGNLPHYSTTKAALAMLVKELAKALGRFGNPGQRSSARCHRHQWLC